MEVFSACGKDMLVIDVKLQEGEGWENEWTSGKGTGLGDKGATFSPSM